MKEKIHPKYELTTITCACGNVLRVRSTRKNIRVEICSKCHPFFTGKQKFVDTTGHLERFMEKYGEALKELDKKMEEKEKKGRKKPELDV